MARAVLGMIGGSGVYDLPGLEDVREERIAIALGRAVGRAADRARSADRGRVPAPPRARAPPLAVRHQLPRQYRRLKRAGVTDIVSVSACGSFKRRSSTAGPLRARRPVRRPHATGARARSSARAASRMCRWRIRSARCLRQRIARGGGGRGHPGRARRHLCLHRGAAILDLCRNPSPTRASATT